MVGSVLGKKRKGGGSGDNERYNGRESDLGPTRWRLFTDGHVFWKDPAASASLGQPPTHWSHLHQVEGAGWDQQTIVCAHPRLALSFPPFSL